uniref:hypothetical protein n=1 Tax=Sulfitobacter sp. TaxID=1903071 RepID=UPI003F6B246F
PQAVDATTRGTAIATATATKAAFDKQNAYLRDTGGPRNAYGEARNALTQPTTSAAINTKASQLETQAQGKRTDPNQTGLSATARTKTLDAAQKQKRRDTGDAIATLDATEETAAITATQTTAEALRDDLAQTLVDLAAIDFTTQATDGARLLDLARKQSDQL